MLKKAEKETLGVHEEARCRETREGACTASEDHKDNLEIWGQGTIERLKTENRPLGYWGSTRSGNFRILIGECTPAAVRIAANKENGYEETIEFLHKELIKYYDKVK